MAAIVAFHDLESLGSPCDNRMLKTFYMGARKLLSKPVTQKKPMTKAILRKIINTCISADLLSCADVMSTRPIHYWRHALFETFAFLCAARFDDLSRLDISHVTVTPTHLSLYFPNRKNDPFSAGHTSLIKVTGGLYCPGKLFRGYLHVLGPNYVGPLFPTIVKIRKTFAFGVTRASYAAIRNVQLKLLTLLDLPAGQIGLHSARRGAVPFLKKQRHSDTHITIFVGWSEKLLMVDRYDDDLRQTARLLLSASLSI
jgi:integrase